jgi:hypothetical protein
MLDTFKDLLAHQYEAALCTLNECIDRCPETAWNAPVAQLAFCQVAFHALFFTDSYLGNSAGSLREQQFHHDHAHVFRDYEELEDRKQQLLYDRPFIKTYLGHCRRKSLQVIAAETAESLVASSGFDRLKFARAELHVYNIRHIQHHAAQLILRLRLDFGHPIPWCGSGWRDETTAPLGGGRG